MKKIIFVEPKPPDLHVFARMPLPRLGTVLLGTTLQKHGYDVKTYIEVVDELDIKDILSADVVGISSITSTSARSYELAKLVREAGIPVFMGGPHVTFLPDEALDYCDYVLRGEVDDIIMDFMKALETGKGLEAIPGIVFKKPDGTIFKNKTVPFCKDVNTIPVPDFTLMSGFKETPYKKLTITPIMTSRGCPYDCNFCSVTSMFGRKYRFRKTELVLEELRRNKEGGGKWVFFYDDNFVANKKRTKILLKAMIAEGLTPNWTAQVRVDVAKDPELMDLMKQSGCHTVYIGLESVNPETLEVYNKNQTVEDIEWCINKLHDKGIRIHGMFVFGSDYDNISTIHDTVRFAKKNDLETVQFLILTPLPGTGCYKDLDDAGRIVSKDWSLYDAHHVVFTPKHMSYYELQSETVQAARRFYSVPQILKRALKLDLFNVSLKAYGRSVTRRWIKGNQGFLKRTRQLTATGSNSVETMAKDTADDIKLKFSQLKPVRPAHSKQH
ncbi:MAG: B12-binding domain-containing radical SAM protein [Thermodesulfobacteriota bacterium]